MTIGKNTLKKFDFISIEEYYNYIMDSYINGNYEQTRELFNRLNQQQKNKFYAYMYNFTYHKKITEFLAK